MSNKVLQQKMENLAVVDVDRVLDEKLPIILNGTEKFATGLTKRTTVEDIIFAMLSVSEPSFKPENLADYGIVEKWQGNERVLDGKIKIYKLIRLWKSLPGNQLQHVKFTIKKRAMRVKSESKNQFSHCTMSPALSKGWNVEKSQRKSSFVQRQLEMAASENTFVTVYSSDESSDVDSDLNSQTSGEDVEHNKLTDHKRYASIKRFNRSRNSSVRQIKKSFIDLVNKQNEIIDKQLSQISETRSKSRSIKAKKSIDINEDDVKQAFSVDEKHAKEYSTLCRNYFKVQSCLNSKVQKINNLKSELEAINGAVSSASDIQVQERVAKINRKLQAKIGISNCQSEKLNNMSVALSQVDDVITLKEKFIQSLELELQQLDSSNKKSLATTSESARSSTSSTSSVFTSISSVSTSQYANKNGIAMHNKQKFSYADNESDTGISSANSEEFNSHLETLV